MPGFGSIVDQDKPARRLSNILQKGKIPHALLFTGIEGIGKRAAAFNFAMALNCLETDRSKGQIPGSQADLYSENPFLWACGNCNVCKKIESYNHPDVISIQPVKDRIRIGQIRELGHTLAMKPYKARTRVVVLSDAHALNPEAGNALLKVLEEPPDRTILILTAHHLHDLLPTIVSRCQHIRFNPVDAGHIEAYLVDQHGIAPQDASLLAGMAKGSLKKAVSLAKNGWLLKRKWILNVLTTGGDDQKFAERIRTFLAFSEILAQSKGETAESLEILKTWFRDMLVLPYSPGRIINKDIEEVLKHFLAKLRVEDILKGYNAIHSAQQKIETNANPRLTLDVMMIELAELNHEKNCRDQI